MSICDSFEQNGANYRDSDMPLLKTVRHEPTDSHHREGTSVRELRRRSGVVGHWLIDCPFQIATKRLKVAGKICKYYE